MKRLKMVLYGEPGVGKSVFASKAPKPFFITTDGNYEWLEEFGAKPEAHKEVSSWSEAKALFKDEFENYETIVLDLTEDLFKWCEYEYCQRNKIEHLSDMGYGKAYDATRNAFFVEISKLLSKDKHIIMIMHGYSEITKDRRGVEHVRYLPTSRIPDKLMDMIEGRVRYFLRCYLKDKEMPDGTLIKERWLSLVPKPDEFGIIRGVNENSIPYDIPLDFDTFAETIGLFDTTTKKIETKTEIVKPIKKVEEKPKEKVVVDEKIAKKEVKEKIDNNVMNVKNVVETVVDEDAEMTIPFDLNLDFQPKMPEGFVEPFEEIKKEEPKKEEVKEDKAPWDEDETPKEEPKTEMSNEEKLRLIKEKLAKLKK